jgi:hypothetical protein
MQSDGFEAVGLTAYDLFNRTVQGRVAAMHALSGRRCERHRSGLSVAAEMKLTL